MTDLVFCARMSCTSLLSCTITFSSCYHLISFYCQKFDWHLWTRFKMHSIHRLVMQFEETLQFLFSSLGRDGHKATKNQWKSRNLAELAKISEICQIGPIKTSPLIISHIWVDFDRFYGFIHGAVLNFLFFFKRIKVSTTILLEWAVHHEIE